MKKLYRRILLFSSLVVFLAVAPLAILYAVGYRASLHNVDPLPVGVILIDTKPRKALVSAQGREYGKTPTSIPNLPPGSVEVSVKLLGYREWKKNLTVESGRATEARDVVLIPEKISPTTIAENINQYALSPNQQLIAISYSDGQLAIIGVDGKVVAGPVKTTARPQQITWSPNNNGVLLKTPDRAYWIYDMASPDSVNRLTAFNGAKNVEWDSVTPGRLISLNSKGELEAYVPAMKRKADLAQGIKHFVVSEQKILAVNNDGVLQEYSLQGALNEPLIAQLPSSIKSIKASYGDHILVLNNDGELQLITKNQPIETISTNVKDMDWSPDGQLAYVVSSQNEVYVYNVRDERYQQPVHELRLITRLSRPIANTRWFAGSRHLIYQVADELWISEIDVRDHAIAWQLDTTNRGDAAPVVGSRGEALYYLKQTKTGSQSLVAAPLVVE